MPNRPLNYVFPLPKLSEYFYNPRRLFIGRVGVKANLYSAIDKSQRHGGSFLVGGYRGVGKTTTVENQIDTLGLRTFQQRTILKSKIDLGIDWELSPKELLTDIIEEFSNTFIIYRTRVLITHLLGFVLLFSLIWFSGDIVSSLNSFHAFLHTKTPNAIHINRILFAVSVYLLIQLALLSVFRIKPIYNILYVSLQLRKLRDRVRYSRAFHSSVGGKKGFVSISRKIVKSEDPISPVRIEQELIRLFYEISKRRFPMELRSRNNRFTDRHPAMENFRWYFPKLKWRYFLFLEQFTKIQPIIVIDELDKMGTQTESSNSIKRKERIDQVLGGIKSLLTSSFATYILISGREMVDAYHSESGYTSALYEGLFHDIFYIPTFLADSSDNKKSQLHSMTETYLAQVLNWNGGFQQDASLKSYIESSVESYENCVNSLSIRSDFVSTCYSLQEGQHASSEIHAENAEFFLRSFVYFLTLHSWGNCKRLITLLYQFLNEYDQETHKLLDPERTFIAGGGLKDGQTYLMFNSKQIQRIYVSAKIYTSFEHAVGSSISTSDDKLIVSTLISALDILKFYGRGFSRDMLDRTMEGINIHSEANLPNLVDDLLNTVFQPYIRRSNDNLFSYRFYSLPEEEIRYVSKSVGARASSFEFALDSTDPVRRFFQEQKKEHFESDSLKLNSFLTNANIQIFLGDLRFYERGYDVAYLHYSNAVQLLKRILREPDSIEWRKSGGTSFSSHYLLICALLKKGLVDEIRDNRELAIRNYREAQTTASYSLENLKVDGATVSSFNFINEPENYREWMRTEGTDEGSGVRHRNMIVHSVLAGDFLRLKSSQIPSSLFFKNVDVYKPGVTSSELYTKILLLNFYGGAYEEVIRKMLQSDLINKDLYKKELDLNQNETLLVFIVAQAILCFYAQKTGESLLGKDSEEMAVRWMSILLQLSNKTDGDIRKELSIQSLTSAIFTQDDEDQDLEVIWGSISLCFLCGRRFQADGLFSKAAQVYTTVLTNWISLLEMLPFSIVNGFGLTLAPEKIAAFRSTPDWVNKLYHQSESAMEKANQGAYVSERQEYRNLTDEARKYGLVEVISGLLERSDNDSSEQLLASPLVWYRSAPENYLLFLAIWEQQSRQLIHSKLRGEREVVPIQFPCRPIDALPKVTSGMMWLRARQQLFSKPIPQMTVSEILEIMKGFYYSIVFRKIGARSEESDSIPPKSIVFYCMYELMRTVSRNQKEELLSLNSVSGSQKLPSKFFDKFYLLRNCSKQFDELANAARVSTNSYRRRLRHKHYLYDDFEDIVYIGEWAYSKALSVGAPVHKEKLIE